MVARELDLRREARQRRRGRSEEAAAEVEGEQEESSASATFASIALAGAEPRQGVAVACVVGMPMGPTGLAASARQQAYSGRTGFRLGSALFILGLYFSKKLNGIGPRYFTSPCCIFAY
jgi:hypothetical protein